MGGFIRFGLAAIFAAVVAGKGMSITRVSPGDGVSFPKKGDTIKVHYTGTLKNGGKKFDSSVDRGQPFSTKIGDRGQPFTTKIGVGQVIKCWDEGMMDMSKGEKAILHCSSEFAYGSRGAGGAIGPNEDLDFEVELIDIL